MKARFVPAIDPPWTSMVPITLGCVPPGHSTPDTFLLVERDGHPWRRIDIYGDTVFTPAVVEWRDFLVVGYGEEVHLVSDSVQSYDLGSDFGSLWSDHDHLLVASSERIVRIGPDGMLLWRTPHLGLDGVIVHEVRSGVIDGSGEWDSPGGWKSFRICLHSGESLSLE